MNKVLVKICVPATGESYDMFVPVDVPIKDVSRVMASGVSELTNGRYLSSGLEQICLREPTGIFNPSLTLMDYGVQNGMSPYLI